MIEYRTGNILSSEMQTLVNPVNTVGIMGAGLALKFKFLYPEMFQRYRHLCKIGLLRIGKPMMYKPVAGPTFPDPWVMFFPTKEHYRDPSKLKYIANGLASVRLLHGIWQLESLAIPALGCGLGGLEWERVRHLIEAFLGDLDLPIEVYVPHD